MSKTLHLIRHAKSSWKDPNLADIDRRLNKRGQRDCQFMGKHMLESGCDFNDVYCSPARRAQLTVQGLYQGLSNRSEDWKTDQHLYTFDFHDLLAWCRKVNENLDSVVIVGHNPALTELCQYLIKDNAIDNVPTCAYVQLHLACDTWAKVNKHCGKLNCFIKPKQFKQS